MPALARRGMALSVTTALILAAVPLRALAADPLLHVDAVDWAKLLGPPPAPHSTQAQVDLAVVLWVQRTRSPADVERVWASMSPNVAAFQQAIGLMVLEQQFPELYASVQAGIDAATPVFSGLKRRWNRPRPASVDDAVEPCAPTPRSGSYPSGTAAQGIVAGRLLADLIPERKRELLARGQEIATLRVVAGAHFPSDVEAGVKLGNAIAQKIIASDAWASRRRATAAELDKLRRAIRSVRD